MARRIDYGVRARQLSAQVPPEGWAVDSLHRIHGLSTVDVVRRLRLPQPRCLELLAAAAAAYEALTDYLAARAGLCLEERNTGTRHNGPDEIVLVRAKRIVTDNKISEPKVRLSKPRCATGPAGSDPSP